MFLILATFLAATIEGVGAAAGSLLILAYSG